MMYVCVNLCHCTLQVEVREQLCGTVSLRPPSCGFWGLNSGQQACTASSSPTESSHQFKFWYSYLFWNTIETLILKCPVLRMPLQWVGLGVCQDHVRAVVGPALEPWDHLCFFCLWHEILSFLSLSLSLFLLKIAFVYLFNSFTCACVCVGTCCGALVETRGWLPGISPLLLGGSWGSNSVAQIWWQVILPIEPVHLPSHKMQNFITNLPFLDPSGFSPPTE